MNIAIGKIGRSVLFDELKHGIHGGDIEAPKLFRKLAELNPNNNYYMLGKSDMSRTKKDLNLPSNIIDIYLLANKNENLYPHEQCYDIIKRKKIKFDSGIFYSGPSGMVNMAEKNVLLNDNSKKAKALFQYENYCGQIYHFLNMTKIPWLSLCPDGRYAPLKARDLINRERYSLSQINKIYKAKFMKNYKNPGNIITEDTKYVSSGIETVFLIDEKKIDFRKIKKDKKFIMISNGGQNRGKVMEEWILKKYPICKIYGKWEKEWIDKYPNSFDSKSMRDLIDELYKSKYTFVSPIVPKMNGWLTSKFLTMAQFGIISFVPPFYDTQQNFKVPGICRVNTPDEMWKRILWLEKNNKERQKIVNELYDILKPEYYDGSYINNIINKKLKEIL